MPNFRNPNPMASRSQREKDRLEEGQDYNRRKVRGPSGTEEDVTYYADGSSTRHCGGPCGPMNYDENGEEC